MLGDGLWLILLAGALGGYYLGRWRAENRRARFDQAAVWKNRMRYREDD